MRISVARRHVCRVLCGVLLQLMGIVSWAAEWSIEPFVSLKGEYNDNILLTTAPHSSVWGITLSPEVRVSGESETLKVTGGLKLNLNRYFGEQGLDANDHFLTVHSRYRTERDMLGLNLESTRDSTLASELTTTGVVQARRQRSLFAINPSWSRSLTETTTITAGYGYSAIDYPDTSGTSLIDYVNQTASVGLRSAFDERTVLVVAGYYEKFKTGPASFQADTFGIEVGFERDFSETLHGSFLLARRNSLSESSSQALVCDGPILFGVCQGTITVLDSVKKESSSAFTVSAALDKRWETGTLSGRLSRDISPSGLGSLIQTDRVQFAWTRQWSPTLSGYLDASVYRSRYIGGVVTQSNSRYYRVEPRLRWLLAQWWMLDAGYVYARQKYDNASEAATANAVYVALTYTWPKVAISR